MTKEETEFIDSIDASFPFEDEEKTRRLVSEGAAFSDNAALMVGLELASESPGRFLNLRLLLLEQLCCERPSMAVKVAGPVIESLIKGISFPTGSAERLLEYCRKQKNCYNALGILSLCSPEMEEAAKSILEKHIERMVVLRKVRSTQR
jgi:hypothetical protein